MDVCVGASAINADNWKGFPSLHFLLYVGMGTAETLVNVH